MLLIYCMKSFLQWMQETVGPVVDQPSNANIAFGVMGANSKYSAREAPNGPSAFDPDKLYRGKSAEPEEDEEEIPFVADKKRKIVR